MHHRTRKPSFQLTPLQRITFCTIVADMEDTQNYQTLRRAQIESDQDVSTIRAVAGPITASKSSVLTALYSNTAAQSIEIVHKRHAHLGALSPTSLDPAYIEWLQRVALPRERAHHWTISGVAYPFPHHENGQWRVGEKLLEDTPVRPFWAPPQELVNESQVLLKHSSLEALSSKYGPLPKGFHFREVDQDAWVHAYRVSKLPPPFPNHQERYSPSNSRSIRHLKALTRSC